MMLGKDSFEIDHVYSDVATDEFKSVQLLGKIKNDMFELTLKSTEELSRHQLDEILNELQRTIFKKMGISVADECLLLMDINGDFSRIEVINNAIKVKNIVKL